MWAASGIEFDEEGSGKKEAINPRTLMACRRTLLYAVSKPSGYALARADDYGDAPPSGDGRSLPARAARLDGTGWTQLRHSTHPETGDSAPAALVPLGRRFSPHYDGGCYMLWP